VKASKKGLISKTPLRAKQPLKAKVKPVKQTKPSITEAKKEAIKYFNRAIKYRDNELIEGQLLFICITCPRRVLFRDRDGRFLRTAHAGHFMPCHKENTRFNELNVNGQCGSCNYNQGEQYKYAQELDMKYGLGTADDLVELSKLKKQWTVKELQDIAEEYKEQCIWYEAQITNPA
jgi:hypothetical protein